MRAFEGVVSFIQSIRENNSPVGGRFFSGRLLRIFLFLHKGRPLFHLHKGRSSHTVRFLLYEYTVFFDFYKSRGSDVFFLCLRSSGLLRSSLLPCRFLNRCICNNRGTGRCSLILVSRLQETTQGVKMSACCSPSCFIGLTDLIAVVFDASDIQIRLRADYKGIFTRLTLADVGKCLVVYDMPFLHGLYGLRILLQYPADNTHHGSRFFNIIRRSGKYDYIAVISLFLHETQRNRIRNTAVQQLLAVDFYHAGNKGHRSGGTEPLQHLPFILLTAEMIDRFACLHVRADQIEFHGIFAESLPVKGIQLVGDIMVAELCIKKVSGREERPDAGVARVLCVLQVVADRTPRLTGFIIAAECRTGRNTDPAVKLDSLFHQDIHNTCGKNTANTAAFQNQTFFHSHSLHIFRRYNHIWQKRGPADSYTPA